VSGARVSTLAAESNFVECHPRDSGGGGGGGGSDAGGGGAAICIRVFESFDSDFQLAGRG